LGIRDIDRNSEAVLQIPRIALRI